MPTQSMWTVNADHPIVVAKAPQSLAELGVGDILHPAHRPEFLDVLPLDNMSRGERFENLEKTHPMFGLAARLTASHGFLLIVWCEPGWACGAFDKKTRRGGFPRRVRVV